jgi:hypothetical protein
MKKTMMALRRLVTLALVWGLAVFYGVQAVAAMLEHRQLRAELVQLHSQYDSDLETYSDELAHGERIRKDEQYQIDLLKKKFGYSEPDETPVIILPEQQ